MAVTAHDFTEDCREEWESFVKQSDNGTMFHELRFLEYHPKGKWDFAHVMFRENGKLIAVLPAGRRNGTVLWSPVGASYGSFIAGDIPFEKALEVVDCFIAYCKVKGYTDAYLIPPPIVYSKNISQHFEYAMLYRKCDFELHYISHAIELKHGEDFLEHFDKTARKTVRKILRDGEITIRDSDDYETFHRILCENKARHNTTPTHTLEDLYKLRNLMPECLRLMMVYHNETPIAGSLLFLVNNQVVLCFYNMLLYEYEHLKPIYLIMYETVRRAYQEGYRWVDIGVSQDTKDANPMTPSIGLINFKERFDARGVLRSTYHFSFQ